MLQPNIPLINLWVAIILSVSSENSGVKTICTSDDVTPGYLMIRCKMDYSALKTSCAVERYSWSKDMFGSDIVCQGTTSDKDNTVQIYTCGLHNETQELYLNISGAKKDRMGCYNVEVRTDCGFADAAINVGDGKSLDQHSPNSSVSVLTWNHALFVTAGLIVVLAVGLCLLAKRRTIIAYFRMKMRQKDRPEDQRPEHQQPLASSLF
ncbi:uncharacterized protein LOC130127989 [Lampris incognitus]|uniref:uncharacterized protein LOC130127989 n=1 Tax=Lampris incognitus TaxID=2546036 RepID=UPI0024B49AA8|nr:uncharacterized protein LOC130127989 [Lampris incognitus]XP_056153675.1 uncharacterized protein LOC130127989 [Lampris incognitus]